VTAIAGRVRRRVGAVTTRCVVAVAVLFALLSVGVEGAGAAPHQDPDRREDAADPRLIVRFQDLEVDARGDFRVLLDVVDAPPGSDVAVDIYDPITDAEGLAASATSTPANLRDNFEPIPLAAGDDPRQSIGFTISVFGSGDDRPAVPGPLPPYRLDEPGVYPIGVRLRAPDGEVLTSIITYLVRRPSADQTTDTTRVALLATVHQDPESPDPDATDSASDDPDGEDPGLNEPENNGPAAVDLSTAQDLDAFLAAIADRAEVPISFSITPDTVAGLAVDPATVDTIDALRAELDGDGREVLGAPYVRLDPASLGGNGLGAELLRQIDLGQRTLENVLGRRGSATWAVDERLDPVTVDVLDAAGVDHLVLPDSAVAGDPTTRPRALAETTGDLGAVTTGFFDLTGTVPSDPLLAANQLLGRVAAAASLSPGGAGVVVRFDAQQVDPAELAAVLDHLERPSTILAPTTVTGLFEGLPSTGTAAALVQPTGRDLGAYPSLVRETHDLIASYASMVPDQPELVQSFDRPLALSAAADLTLDERSRILNGVTGELRGRFDAVSIPERDRVTLGTRDARFPLPINLDLDEPVRVVISLEASDRLEFPEERIETTLTGDRTLVEIPVRARATGDTPLRITVRTPDGQVLLDEGLYSVRSTAVSGVGVVLTIGAAAFLALWWGRHWHQGRSEMSRRRHRTPSDDDLFVDDAGAPPGQSM
jgi:hypothetical protein